MSKGSQKMGRKNKEKKKQYNAFHTKNSGRKRSGKAFEFSIFPWS